MQIQLIQITPDALATLLADSVEAVLTKRLQNFNAPPSEKLLSRKEARLNAPNNLNLGHRSKIAI
ncbi:hypothetical protein [Runella sp.]|jgi:hypothetical protein|uniref:hypothetical protein n=1 Tax=Runella sp. TaxID=1960881 RepID=UPI002621130F|nr:hypothetical protein [Runella sp.]